MKKIIPVFLLLLAPALSAQVQRRSTANTQGNARSESAVSTMSVRARSFYEATGQSAIEESQWSKVIYRELDLMKGANASLFFPEEPMEGQPNLFRLMVNLLADNQITAYEYLDGREIFNQKYELNVKDMFDKFHFVYEEKPGRAGKQNQQFILDENDVPSGEVLSYYIKERWYFDQRTSQFTHTIDAICPILHRTGDFGGEAKYPMFWLKYDDIRPYLSQFLIMSEGINNTLRYTFEDFFVLRQYEGDIYKTMNLQNKSLMQIHQDPESLKMAQEQIESELKQFEESLWVPTPQQVAARKQAEASLAAGDSTGIAVNVVYLETQSEKKEKSVRTQTNPREVKSKEEKEAEKAAKAAAKASSSSAAPARSVRRTR